MYNFSIGVMLESFRTDTKTALKKAADVGATGIQVYATNGDMAPEALVIMEKVSMPSGMTRMAKSAPREGIRPPRPAIQVPEPMISRMEPMTTRVQV